MGNKVGEIIIKKVGPIVVAGCWAAWQAYLGIKDSEHIQEMEDRIAMLEEKTND